MKVILDFTVLPAEEQMDEAALERYRKADKIAERIEKEHHVPSVFPHGTLDESN